MHEKCKECETNDDAVNLVRIIKEIVHSMMEVLCHHWNVETTMGVSCGTVQCKKELPVVHHKRFVNVVDAVVTQ